MFSSLASYNFRVFTVGQIISLIGMWVQAVALSWLVLKMTGSATQLGLITAIQFVPMLLFGLFGGWVADRFPKHKVLFATTSGYILLSVVTAVIVQTNAIQLWMLYVIAGLAGLIMVVDNPTRQSFVSELVGRNRIRNAVTLNSMVFNITRVVGPSVAGIAIAGLGMAACFWLDAISMVAVLVSLSLLRTNELYIEPAAAKTSRVIGQIMESIRYAVKTKKIFAPLAMMTLIGAFTYEFSVVFPIFAAEVLGGGAQTYGQMMAAMGAGAILGGLWLARFPVKNASAIVPAAVLFGAAMVILSLTRSMQATVAALVVLGMGSTFYATTGNTILQLNSSPAMRGRVMALWGMAFTGLTPIGAPVVGLIAEQASAPVAILFGGLVALGSAVIGYTILTGRYGRVAGKQPAYATTQRVK